MNCEVNEILCHIVEVLCYGHAVVRLSFHIFNQNEYEFILI